MKKILFYDTETSGLPLWNLPSEHPDQPRVVQLAAELCNEETGDTLQQMNMIIRPEGWTIPDEVAAVHGITTERAMAEGVAADQVVANFIEMWKEANLRAGHNESFDMRMLRIEIMRHATLSMETVGPGDGPEVPFADYWKTAPAYCTQGNSVKILNLPPTPKMVAARRKGPKSPNLAEAYKHFTGQDLEGAHDAMVDVRACKAVYYGIKNHLKAAA
jgi:DNA polymerase-3 subunit epsilon